jgi:hypothetical protein
MSDELTRKVIEAGIIPAQAVKQMKAWKMLPDDMPEEEKAAATEEELLGFVKEIDELLEKSEEMPEMRETMLDAHVQFAKGEAKHIRILSDMGGQQMTVELRYVTDSMGRYIIENVVPYAETVARVGSQFRIGEGVFEITEVEALYHGETREPRFYRCAVQGVPPHAQMRDL